LDGGLNPPLLPLASFHLPAAFALGLTAMAFFLAPLLCPIPVSAQAPAPAEASAKIDSVKIIGSKRFVEEELVRTIGLAPGTIVSRAQIQAAADKLSALGWFVDVSYKFRTSQKGLEIEFTVRDAPSAPLWFDNFPWFTDSEMADAIRASGIPYDGTAPESGAALDAIREAVAGLLKSHHILGEVEGEMVAAPATDGMVERFRVTGADMKVTSLEFTDALARNDPQVTQVLDILTGKQYSRYALAVFILEHVRPAYVSRGYLRVNFGEPASLFVGDPTKPLANEVTVRVPIQPGIQYHWAGITWDGLIAESQEMLDTLLGMIPGDPADELKMRAGWDRIVREYARHGYLEAKVVPELQYNDAKASVTCAVHISEGIQYRMGRLMVTGLSLTAERQLMSNWKLARGDVFDNSFYQGFVDDGARKLFEKTPVRFTHLGHLLQRNLQTKTVDVMLDFQ